MIEELVDLVQQIKNNMKGLDILKIKNVQDTLDDAGKNALSIAISEYLTSGGNNFAAANTLKNLNLLVTNKKTTQLNS